MGYSGSIPAAYRTLPPTIAWIARLPILREYGERKPEVNSMIDKRNSARWTFSNPLLVLILAALVLASANPAPVFASSAAPRINLKDVYLNLRSTPSVHVMVKQSL